MAESISEGTLRRLARNVGDYVEQDEEIASIETDKIDVAVNAPEAGIIDQIFVQEQDTVNVGQHVALVRTDGALDMDRDMSSTRDSQAPKIPADSISSARMTEPSRLAERESEVGRNMSSTTLRSHGSSHDSPSHAAGSNRGEHRVKMSRMRMRIAERLKQSQNSAASLTTFNEVDMSQLISLRKKYKDDMLEAHGVKLGFMGAFMKAASLALKEVPEVNASIEGPGNGDTIVYRDYVDISVAVATPKGLVTAVIRNCESMSLMEQEKAIAEMSRKARDGKITMEDLAGGNITLSNAGMFGSFLGTPIINLAQTAVLGIYGIKERPVAVNGKVEIRPMMYLGLTYDHRLLDGREAVRFLARIKDYIEDVARMVLG